MKTEKLATPTVRSLLQLPREYIEACTHRAYECVQDGRLDEAELIGRWLVATDHRNWYFRILLATCLHKQGRPGEALAEIDAGLGFRPNHPELTGCRRVLRRLQAGHGLAHDAPTIECPVLQAAS